MTTIDSAFWATGGNVSYNVGVTAWGSLHPPLDFGMIGIGQSSGVFGHVEGEILPQRASFAAIAGVLGGADTDTGMAGVSNSIGVFGQSGDAPDTRGFIGRCGVFGASTNHFGVFGLSEEDDGVAGDSVNGNGVSGTSRAGNGAGGTSQSGAGVFGTSNTGDGVLGASGSYGVRGLSTGSVGVVGDSWDYIGVVGYSHSSIGVRGESEAAGSGVEGNSRGGPGVSGKTGGAGPEVPGLINVAGVIGSSDQQIGVMGRSNVIGVYGYAGNTDPTRTSVGVVGRADPAFPKNYAGVFIGNVLIGGDLTLQDTTVAAKIKNAIVPFPDGTKRVLHCMESPEHWFEDFGAAKLKRGRAVVRLDRDFTKVIRTGYHVFVTPEGDCAGLYVTNRRRKSFEVRELGGGKSSIPFAYRIVGRRKDIKDHQRFAKIEVKPLELPKPTRPAQRTPRPRLPLGAPEQAAQRAARDISALFKKPGGKPVAKPTRRRRHAAARQDRQLSALFARLRKQVGARTARRRGKRA
jgi:hypothetical protein